MYIILLFASISYQLLLVRFIEFLVIASQLWYPILF